MFDHQKRTSQPTMEKLWFHPTIRERPWLNRGDVGFGQKAIMVCHEAVGEKCPEYHFALKLTCIVPRAISRVPWPLWLTALLPVYLELTTEAGKNP